MQFNRYNLLSKKQRCDTNRVKYYYENDKKEQESKQEINTEIYPKKKKIKRESMEEIDIIICLKKRNKN